MYIYKNNEILYDTVRRYIIKIFGDLVDESFFCNKKGVCFLFFILKEDNDEVKH